MGSWEKVFPAVLAHAVLQHELEGSLSSCHVEFHEDIWIQYSILIRLEAIRLVVFIISTRKEPHCLKVQLCGHVV